MPKPTTTQLFREKLASMRKTAVGPHWNYYSITKEFTIPVGKGNLKVWIGDPSYALHDEIYYNVFAENEYYDGLYVYDNGKDLYWFCPAGTGGDGTFKIIGTQTTKSKSELGVDSCCLCIMSANLAGHKFEDEKIYNREEGASPDEDVREKDTNGGVFYTFRDEVRFNFAYDPFYIQAFSDSAYFRIWDGHRIFRGIEDDEGYDPYYNEYGGYTDEEYINQIKARKSLTRGK
jgi:hypothetical protein